VLLDVLAGLVIELDQAVHCNGDRDRFKDDSLPIKERISKKNTIYPATSTYPDMRKGRTERCLAVQAQSLRNNRDNSHNNADNTVLEDASPDNLHNSQHRDTPRIIVFSLLH
jgi:hypothetical protein